MDEDLKTLTELLDGIQDSGCRGEIEVHGRNYPDTISNEEVAAHLVANGVTVQSPEPWQNCSNCGNYGTRIGCSLCAASIDGNGRINSVPTYWVPMPGGPRKEAGA